MRTPILLVELATPDVPGEPTLGSRSWMISGASAHSDLNGYFMLAPHVKKDASLGVHFADLTPLPNNTFQLELGVVLPDLFPNVEGQPDFSLSVTNGTTLRELCFSNIMARLRFSRDDKPYHAITSRRSLKSVREGKISFVPADASVELLRTFATARFDLEGATAEEAFEEHCEACIHDMIERLNRLLKALPFVDVAPGRVFSMAYSRASLPPFYFIIKGATERMGHGWLSPHVGRTMLNPPDLSPAQHGQLQGFLTGATLPDAVESFLYAAQTFVDGGVIEYVLLLSVIAAEVATQRFVQSRLLSASVSKSKLAEAEKDLTYSLMLNVVLSAIAPDGMKPDKELVGKMNRARGLRNAYMHTGELPRDHSEVIQLFEATKQYVAYLRATETSVGCSSSTPSND